MSNRFQKGIGLVEVLVAISILSILVGTLVLITNMYLSGAESNLYSTQGAYLAEEGVEAVKSMSDVQWSNITSLSTSTNYFLTFSTSSSAWATTTKASSVGIFYRTFALSDVYRDAEGHLVTNGGISDSQSKKVTVSVSWMTKTGTTTKIISAYITNILGD
jgi:type II secretory pathway pseudopilin PulG